MGLIFRSCEVVNYCPQHTTSLVGNPNLRKSSRSYGGCHISNNIALISEELQQCYKLFKLFIYNVCKTTSESKKVFYYLIYSSVQKDLAAVKRLRVCLRIGRQDYTVQLAAPRGQHEI